MARNASIGSFPFPGFSFVPEDSQKEDPAVLVHLANIPSFKKATIACLQSAISFSNGL
jgi:hypothetical protein